MKSLKLSIVIPAYNEESYIQTCLQAIAEQSVKADEVIVVDNNSTDKTAELARQFDFVTLINEQQQGLYFSRQTGMNAASGQIICRIDADTIIDNHWVAEVKKAFADPGVHAVSGPVGYYDMPFARASLKIENILLQGARALNYHFLAGANMAVRKAAWQVISDQLCNEPFLFEDIDIAIHLKNHGMIPSYVVNMTALMSSRRLDDTPVDFLRYIGGHTRTLEYHNHKALGGGYAEGIWSLVYFGIKPFHMMYDPELRRPSLSYMLKRRQARPDPMAAK